MTFLFWNLNKKPIGGLVAQIASEHDVDVILLAENEMTVAELMPQLNKDNKGATYYSSLEFLYKVNVITRLPQGSIVPVRDDGGVSVRHLKPPIGRDILLIGVHLPSKLHQEDLDQTINSTRIGRIIDECESKFGHHRTVVTGDFNMDPFESGVVAADGFHAVSSRRIAQGESRTVQGASRRFLYNPMWRRFGDHDLGPPGTYFYRSSKQVSYFWHMFDQVLLRPDLLECFRDDEMKVVTQIGSTSLVDEALIPNGDIASDHLPIIFQLHL